MKQIYAVDTAAELEKYQAFYDSARPKLDDFIVFLKEKYEVYSLPRAVVWTNAETATKLISNIPIPAYTNDYRTVFCPDLESWRRIYLCQLDESENAEARKYYETALNENHVLQILGHEFVHHSELFLDDAYERSIWFEEGMCEYISRKYFLTDKEFEEAAWINSLLVQIHQRRYGIHALDEFGAATYEGGYADIFFEYWRSFLAVQKIVERFGGDIPEVFREYHRWHHSESEKTLLEWFDMDM